MALFKCQASGVDRADEMSGASGETLGRLLHGCHAKTFGCGSTREVRIALGLCLVARGWGFGDTPTPGNHGPRSRSWGARRGEGTQPGDCGGD